MVHKFFKNNHLHHLKSSFFVLFSKNQSHFIHALHLYSHFNHALFTLRLCPFLTIVLSFSLYLYVNLLIYYNPCNSNIFLCIIITKTTLFFLQNIICFHHATIQIPFTFCTPIHALFTLNHAFSHLITLTIHAPEIDQQQISHKPSHKS